MKYIQLFFASSIVFYLSYFSVVLLLIDAPIPADYWVKEMITVKKELVKSYAGKRKIIVVGGSSTLFGIDAEYASKQLGIPVINFGLYAGLRLDHIFKESMVVETGDLLILPLEPPYYDCHKKMDASQVTNIIAWDHDVWRNMSYIKKAEFVALISPSTFKKMIISKREKKFVPSKVINRLNVLDDSLVLSKFRERTPPTAFKYSAYNLDDYGDILKTEGTQFKGAGYNTRQPNHVCTETAKQIMEFIKNMKQRGVSVYFANTPYTESENAKNEVRNSELSFQKEFMAIGCFIDKREDLVFNRKYFFDSNLHLNSEGRAIRTELFINSIRRNVFSGKCDQI